jgi:primosomal replication protein N
VPGGAAQEDANRCVLGARLVRQGRARYTPAGLRVQELGFRYTGSVVEADMPRQLDFEFDAVAVGDVAGRLAALALGTRLRLGGFIAPASRRSSRVRLHITDYGTD